MITFDDCIEAESERHIRALLDGRLQNPDGKPVPVTYFLSLEGCYYGAPTDTALVRRRHHAGDEIAAHTRTHATDSRTSESVWRSEISANQTFATRLGLEAPRGFRAPFVQTNAAMFEALTGLGLTYDSSIFEDPFYAPVSRGLSDYLWPYTFDFGPAQNCQRWKFSNACPSRPIPGLWEIPLYYYVSDASPDRAEYLGSFDIGDPGYSGGSRRLSGQELRTVLDLQFDHRYRGNRAPLNLYMHAPSLADPVRREVFQSFLSSVLARGDVWAITMQGLIEWMREPVPAAGMSAWFEAYCQRHPCQSTMPTAIPADALASASPLRVHPSPSTGLVTVEATTVRSDGRVSIHDALGRTLIEEIVPGTGPWRRTFDLSREPPGVYFVRLSDGPQATSAPLLIVR